VTVLPVLVEEYLYSSTKTEVTMHVCVLHSRYK